MAKYLILLFCALLAFPASAEEPREFRLAVPPEIEASGLMAYLLPRFALKTGRRAVLHIAPGEAADASIGLPAAGAFPVMQRGDAVYFLRLTGDSPAARRFADWLVSDIGKRAIGAYVPQNGPAFSGAPEQAAPVAPGFDGDLALGAQTAALHCGRCHRTTADGTGIGIASTPSFMALRALPDWPERFMAFFVRAPHPAFLRVEGISPPFDPSRPPSIVPVLLTPGEVEALLAYVSVLTPADLGAPIKED